MPLNNKIEFLLDKLTPCIQKGDLNKCIEDSIQFAQEIGINSNELLGFASHIGREGGHSYTFVFALTAEHWLKGKEKATAFYFAGIAAKNLKKFSIAEDYYQKAIEANPKSAEAHLNYAFLLRELDRKEDEEDHYRKAIEANPKLVEAHINYANFLTELGRKDDAEDHYQKAIKANPEYANAHNNYGIFLAELNRKKEAEKHYLKAIEINPKLAEAYSNYANLLTELDIKEKAEDYYKKAIEANPKLADAHNNYALLLIELNRVEEVEDHYQKAIKANPEYAEAHYNYANFLIKLDRKVEAGDHYQKAIQVNPKLAEAHYNYADLLTELSREKEAEDHYQKAIEANPKYGEAHLNYANLLKERGRKDDAEDHYQKAIEVNPKLAQAHNAYSLILMENNRTKEALNEIGIAYNIFEETGNIVLSHLSKAWFYQKYSEKNLRKKKYHESSNYANISGEEYLIAAESTDGKFKENLMQQGNIQIAKSFIRKIPVKSWYNKIYYRFGKNLDIIKLIDNLKNAAIYYEKASFCSIDEKQEICGACHTSVSVFSEILKSMNCYINGDYVEINKKSWNNLLDEASEIYETNKLTNGVAFVNTLRQLTKCVDELAEYQINGLSVQEDKLGKCYNNLIDISENLQGSLKVISDYTENAIKDFAKKKDFNFIEDTSKERRRYFKNNWVRAAVAAILLSIIGSIIANLFFELDLDLKLLNFIKFLLNLIY